MQLKYASRENVFKTLQEKVIFTMKEPNLVFSCSKFYHVNLLTLMEGSLEVILIYPLLTWCFGVWTHN